MIWNAIGSSRNYISPFTRGAKERPLRISIDPGIYSTGARYSSDAIEAIVELSQAHESVALFFGDERVRWRENSVGNEQSSVHLSSRPQSSVRPGRDFRDLQVSAERIAANAPFTVSEAGVLGTLQVAEESWAQGCDIFVTEHPGLLLFRDEWRFCHLNILTPSEAASLAGQLLRSRDNYTLAWRRGRYGSNRSDFYSAAVRTAIPNFSVLHSVACRASQLNRSEASGESIAVFGRLSHALQCRDAVFRWFYRKPDPTSRDEMFFYLNYFLLLACGALDALAALVGRFYGIRGNLSFNRPASLSSLRERSPSLWKAISSEETRAACGLLFPLRNQIHGEGFGSMRVQSSMGDGGDFGTIPAACLRQLKDLVRFPALCDRFGLIDKHGQWNLEPYTFVGVGWIGLVERIEAIAAAVPVDSLGDLGFDPGEVRSRQAPEPDYIMRRIETLT